MGYIHTDDLEWVFKIYDVKVNAKAKAAISNLEVDGNIFKWNSIEEDLPEDKGAVVVLAELEGVKEPVITGAYYTGEEGWILNYSIAGTAFSIKKWAKIPK